MSRAEAFEWAKDSAIKAPAGNAIVLYHGTGQAAAAAIEKEGFTLAHAGQGADTELAAGVWTYGHGVFLTDNAEISEAYANHISTFGVEFEKIPQQEGQVLRAVANVHNVAEGQDLKALLAETYGRLSGPDVASTKDLLGHPEYSSTLQAVAAERGFDAIRAPAGAEEHELVVLDPKNVAVIQGSARDAGYAGYDEYGERLPDRVSR